MKERGMIFNEHQVRALLDGNMTQTRRPLKWKRTRFTEIGERDDGSNWPWSEDCENCCDYWHPCPFGVVGDRIWVRETFATLEPGSYEPVKPQQGYCQEMRYAATDRLAKSESDIRGYKWIPSLHMPRWASRIMLEITDVRVERLKDAEEGHLLDDLGDMLDDCDSVAGRAFNHAEHYAIAGVPVGMCPEMHGFKAWWDKANGAGSFDSNPWVWVIEFKRVEGGAA